jgi:hypothetical protein
MTADPAKRERCASTAIDAWNALLAHGLETPGRDDDLMDVLHGALQKGGRDDNAGTFDEAVRAASLEEFVRAFFKSAMPYVDMLKDILKWFERAGAKQGPSGWRLAWDGGDIPELQHFREWISALETRTVTIEHPAISFDNCLVLVKKLGNAPSAAHVRELISQQNYRDLPASIRQFAYGYEHWYEDIATLPAPPAGPAWLVDIWNIIRRALTELGWEGVSGRGEAFGRARAMCGAKTADNGLALDSLCMLESDLWLLRLVASYGAILASPSEQGRIGPHIEEFFGTMPRVSFIAEDDIETFAAFLDLPLWARRHEFFSAWIASRMIEACGDHEQELLHDKGVIALPFKRTEVSRIRSSRPERILFSERRTPLDDPKGKGRSENVQPDFSIWRSGPLGDVCDLVVEVKHYLQPAKTSWANVFEDYAAAHPSATVVLVNYGRPGTALDAVSAEMKSRCRLIGNLRPARQAALDELTELVSRAVGPVFRGAVVPDGGVARTRLALVLDRSYSMKAEQESLRAILKQYAEAYGASKVAIAAFDAGAVWDANAPGFDAAVNYARNSETMFTDILSRLLFDHPELIFITDADGKGVLDRHVLGVYELDSLPDGTEVVRVAMR